MRNLILTTLLVIPVIGNTAPVSWKEHNPLCTNEVSKKVDSLGVKSQWVRMLAGAPGSFAYRAPISIGTWAQVIVKKDEVTVSKMTETNAVSYHYSGETCNPQIAIKNAPKEAIPDPKALGDADLKKVIDTNKEGVIYVWSPHMTLSAQGFHNITEAAKKLGVPVFAYVDSTTKPSSIKKIASKNRLPASASTSMQSFDLVMRGATIHYPATFTFKDGKLSRWAKHGYEDEKQFEEFLKQEFNK